MCAYSCRPSAGGDRQDAHIHLGRGRLHALPHAQGAAFLGVWVVERAHLLLLGAWATSPRRPCAPTSSRGSDGRRRYPSPPTRGGIFRAIFIKKRGCRMQRAADIPEVIVSENGASIPAHVLRDAEIQPGDRLTFVRTTGGSLAMMRAAPTADGPSLRTVVGICPRPAGVSPEADQAFLHNIRYGDDESYPGRFHHWHPRRAACRCPADVQQQ